MPSHKTKSPIREPRGANYTPDIAYLAKPPEDKKKTQSFSYADALAIRLSPYYGSENESIPVNRCTQEKLSTLRKIAQKANKAGQKPKIKGHMSEKETVDDLCQKLIQQNVLVITGGILTSKYD